MLPPLRRSRRVSAVEQIADKPLRCRADRHVSGRADASSRAAMLGRRRISRSAGASPSPTSPTMTMPSRCRSDTGPARGIRSRSRHTIEPRVDRGLAVALRRLRVTEQDERVIPEIPIDGPCMARGGLRDAAPEVRDCLVQSSRPVPPATASPGHFARESGDLGALGLAVPDRHGVRCVPVCGGTVVTEFPLLD